MNYEEKVHGYTGAGGLIQAFAGGYFLWDLVVTLQNISAFGLGMLAHAISALFVFSLGFVRMLKAMRSVRKADRYNRDLLLTSTGPLSSSTSSRRRF